MRARAARQLVFRMDSTGAADDLAPFMDDARNCATRFGRRGPIGKVARKSQVMRLIGAGALLGRQRYDSECGVRIGRSVRAFMGQACDRATSVLSDLRVGLDAGGALPKGRNSRTPDRFPFRRTDTAGQLRAGAQTAANG